MKKKIALFLDKSIERCLGFFERFGPLVMLISAGISLIIPFVLDLDDFSLMLILFGPMGVMGSLLMLPILALPLVIWLDPALYQKRLKENPPPPETKTSRLKEIAGRLIIIMIGGAIVIAITLSLYYLTGILLNFTQQFSLMILFFSFGAVVSQISPNTKRPKINNRVLEKIRRIKNKLFIRMNHKYSSF